LDSDLRIWFSEHKSVLILAIAALIMIFYFLFPFMDGLILGTVFAYVGRPIRDKFRKRWRLGALVASICIVVPIFLILGLGMLEIANQVIALAQNQEAVRMALGSFLARLTLEIPPAAQEMIAGSLQNIIEVMAPIAASMPVFAIGRTVSLGIINFIISIPVCYFVLLDGEGFVESVMAVMPPAEVEVYRKYRPN
jgi:predicted PurR-regulated permease PerM